VFCLVNLDETTKGALFARYSRYSGSIHDLYEAEFAHNLGRGEELYDRVFFEYGDDSVAQLGSAHIAFEGVSQIASKIIERGRIAAYLEQSTRYIPFDQRDQQGRYRYYRQREYGNTYTQALDAIFELYKDALGCAEKAAAASFPRAADESESVWRRSVRAKALDAVRNILPIATLTNVGVHATGQALEQMLLRLLASDLPEARKLGELALEELQKVIGPFVRRVPRPDRGGETINHLRRLRERAAAALEHLGNQPPPAAGQQRSQRLGPAIDFVGNSTNVRLLDVRGGLDNLLAALLFEVANESEVVLRESVKNLPYPEKLKMLRDLLGLPRANRRHKPGRGLEALSYRFEIVCDYGAFRDLQRHRILTIQWQPPNPDLGYTVPYWAQEFGVADHYRRAAEIAQKEHDRLRANTSSLEACYPLLLAHRSRFVMDLNAREALHLIELRSGEQGHPSYRAVALQMLRAIIAVHPFLAPLFEHADRTPPEAARLERLAAERRAEERRRQSENR